MSTQTLSKPNQHQITKWICPDCAQKTGLVQRGRVSWTLGRCTQCDERNLVRRQDEFKPRHG